MIEVSLLTKVVEDRVILDNLSFSVTANEVLAIMGSNGSGKTSLLKAILNETSYLGTIKRSEILGQIERVVRSEHVYFVGDVPQLYNYLSAIEFVQFVLKVKSKNAPAKGAINHMLEEFGIREPDSGRLILEYSFGMRRKVALAAAFLLKPLLMVLDEPTVGLDAQSVSALSDQIKQSSSTTFVIASHEADFVGEVCSSLLILKQGQLAYYSSDFKSQNKDLRQLLGSEKSTS